MNLNNSANEISLLNAAGRLTEDPSEVSNIFSDYYESKFGPLTAIPRVPIDRKTSNIFVITEPDVKKSIMNVNCINSIGPDSIPMVYLK